MCKIFGAFSFSLMCLLSLFPLHARVITPQPSDTATKQSEITVDGKKVKVYFNDGDTLKILSGEHEKARVRITGLNTLETYGPVHQWHEHTEDQLFDVANEATQMAQKGGWHCTLEKGKDTYGRRLAVCDDLAMALIENGLAHAYSIDAKPADPDYLKAQKRAQEKALGMWKGGVPKFIITSLHSADERVAKNAQSYDRLISTADGHSEKNAHQKSYSTCERVCLKEKSCMVYVPYTLRYGNNRPECIKSELGGQSGNSNVKTAARRTN